MNKIIPSFTSQRSRLSKEKIDIVKSDILPKYEISSFHEVSTFQNVNIEIGSGYGYTIIHLAKNNPEKNFIACEVYIDAISSMCKKIAAEGLENVRVYVSDARLLFEQIPDGFLEITQESLLKVIVKIREHQPSIVLANAECDRHPDHSTGAKLVARAAYLSGLVKIKTNLNYLKQLKITSPWATNLRSKSAVT